MLKSLLGEAGLRLSSRVKVKLENRLLLVFRWAESESRFLTALVYNSSRLLTTLVYNGLGLSRFAQNAFVQRQARLKEGANKSHVCSALAYGPGCKAWFVANGLVLCKKHNTAGRPVSHALRGFTATGFLRYPTSTGPGMPSVRCLERQLLCKPECHEYLFAPSLICCQRQMGLAAPVGPGAIVEYQGIEAYLIGRQD